VEKLWVVGEIKKRNNYEIVQHFSELENAWWFTSTSFKVEGIFSKDTFEQPPNAKAHILFNSELDSNVKYFKPEFWKALSPISTTCEGIRIHDSFLHFENDLEPIIFNLELGMNETD